MRVWKYKNIILTTLIILTLAFIWGNSLMPRDESTEMSTWALRHFNEVLGRISGRPLTVSEHFVRKLAHFTEFGILGFLVSLTESGKDHPGSVIAAGAVSGLAVAICDELIQLTSPGRSCQISDMLLDFSGALAASLFVWALLGLIKKKKG